jgi:hypothetical protein
MKQILFSLITTFGFLTSQAQFLDLKGFIVNANSHIYIEDGEIKTDPAAQLYHFSFMDKVLIHTILIDGAVDVSQIYQLDVDDKFMDGQITVFKCSALS